VRQVTGIHVSEIHVTEIQVKSFLSFFKAFISPSFRQVLAFSTSQPKKEGIFSVFITQGLTFIPNK